MEKEFDLSLFDTKPYYKRQVNRLFDALLLSDYREMLLDHYFTAYYHNSYDESSFTMCKVSAISAVMSGVRMKFGEGEMEQLICGNLFSEIIRCLQKKEEYLKRVEGLVEE